MGIALWSRPNDPESSKGNALWFGHSYRPLVQPCDTPVFVAKHMLERVSIE